VNLSYADIPDVFWILDGYLAGEYPGSDEAIVRANVRWLQEAGATCFIELTDAGEHWLKPYVQYIERAGAHAAGQHVRMPIQDLSIPMRAQMAETLDFIDSHLALGHTVYAHCMGGIGRTGSVVGCTLARHAIANGRAIMPKVAQLHSVTRKRDIISPEMPSQVRLIESWHKGE
jgi:predicted protein tyrosine phosphatase